MLKLHGFVVSHYYNMVKHTLLTKDIQFEEIAASPAVDSSYLEKSPLGKIPCIETSQGFLSETSAILDYIEAAYPEVPLSPTDIWGQAKMREIIKICELYIENQGRRLIPAAMGSGNVEPAQLADAAAVMSKGFSAIDRLGHFTPYLLGDKLTLADIFLRYALVVVSGGTWLPSLNTAAVANIEIHTAVPSLAAWEALMNELPVSQRIDALVTAELPRVMAERRSRTE